MTTISAYFLWGWECIPYILLYKTWTNHAVVVEWWIVWETGTDELHKQLTVEENHNGPWIHETLLQNTLMIVVCGLLLNVLEENNGNVVVVKENNRNVVAVVGKNNRNEVVVAVLMDKKQ